LRRGGGGAGLWARAPDDAWAVGPQTIRHFDGRAWTAAARPEDLTAVWGSGAHDLWAVASDGTVLHGDGASWSVAWQAPFPLTAVTGSGPSNVWAGGNGGMVHFDGSSWRRLDASGYPKLWADGDGKVWAASGEVVRLDD